jgi:hypothetical protein
VVSAVKLRKLWDTLSELRSSLCERRLKRTVVMPNLLSVKTAQFTEFFRRLKVFENRVLRRMFGRKKNEVTGEWSKLHNVELNDLNSSPIIVRIMNRKE